MAEKIMSNGRRRLPFISKITNFSPTELIMLFSVEKGKYLSEYHREFDVTYAHTSRIFNRFEKMGLVSFERVGRKTFIELNPKYRQVISELGYRFRKMLEMMQEDRMI